MFLINFCSKLGPQSCGKTSLVKLLAQLTGHPLVVLPMNSSMDTTELLGGFEQSDVWRHIAEVASQVQIAVRQVERQCIIDEDPRQTMKVQSLERDWAEYTSLSTS
ncbi:unnamed protein product, partial [Lymnaea stagnalis]